MGIRSVDGMMKKEKKWKTDLDARGEIEHYRDGVDGTNRSSRKGA